MKNGNQGDGGGAPIIVLGEESIIQVESLAAYLSTEQIADYFGIGRTTFYEIMKRQPEVSERYRKGRATAIATLGQGLLQDAMANCKDSRKFYLRTQGEHWNEKFEHEVEGGVQHTVTFVRATKPEND